MKTAWRNLLKNRGYTLINICGIAVGMAVAMLISLWIYDEVTFNSSHPNYKNVAQVRRYFTDPNIGETTGVSNMHYPMATILKSDYKQYFKHVVMAWWQSGYTLSGAEKKVFTTGQFIEPEGLDMLAPIMLKGNYGALHDMHSIVISASTARTFFGDSDPINKTIKIDNKLVVSITGVYKDFPANSDYSDVKFFSPWSLWLASNDWIQRASQSWDNSSFPIFIQLQPNVSMAAANAAVKDFFYRSVPKEISVDMQKYKMQALLYPMKDWHLYSEFRNGLPDGGRITFVWLFGIIGIFVLFLACINFINLNTARADKRAKEVGIRKAIGSSQRHLVQQFMGESLLVVLLAFVLSLLLLVLFLPAFNQLADKKISIPFFNPYCWLGCFAFIVFTTLLAGAYPAFYLAGFQPVKVLKGSMRTGKYASLPRQGLVVVQFTVSVILVIGTLVVYKQIQFAQERPIGYDSAGLITLSKNDPGYDGKIDLLRRELINTGVVQDMELSSSPMTAIYNNSSDFDWAGKLPREYSFTVTNVSYGFGKMSGWNFISGRDFSREFETDSTKIIINETAAKEMGFKDPIGQVVRINGGTRSMQIVGVIKDMVMGSPYEPVKRAIFFLDKHYDAASQIVIRIKPTVSANLALPKIKTVFENIVPTAMFDYKFVDDEYAKKFSQEQRIGKLSTCFSMLAIFISCLGLFGLASFVAEQRTKEIGIRKVIGASIFNIWNMLSKEFVGLVSIAVALASPVSYVVMNNWIQRYAYHTNVSWWIFVLVGLSALLITLLTVSYQAIRAAMADPVKSLRSA